MIIQSLFGDLLSSHVGWNLDYDRTGPSVAEIVESAAHDIGDLIGLNDDLAVFGNGLKCPYRREIGPHGVLTESRASGQIQDRDVVAECLSDATHRVFRAGAALMTNMAALALGLRPDLRQAVAGVFNGSRFLGLMLGPVLITPVYESASIRGVLIVAAIILLAVALITRWAKPAA